MSNDKEKLAELADEVIGHLVDALNSAAAGGTLGPAIDLANADVLIEEMKPVIERLTDASKDLP